MMDYSEIVKDLRYCADPDTGCSLCKYFGENCEQKVIAKAADAIEELKKDLERSKEYESFWENAAKTCPHYIYNKHDRGDDSLCDVLMTEPPKEET